MLGGGGVGAAKGVLPSFLVPKGNQPTACTLALWRLKFGPTEGSLGGGGGRPGGGGGGVPRWGGLRATHYSECRIFTSQQTTFVWRLVLLI